MPDSTRALVAARVFESFLVPIREAMKAGTIVVRPDAHLTWMQLELDRQGWDEAIARVEALFDFLFEQEEAAGARLEQSGEEPIPATVGLFAFESPPFGAPRR